MIDTDNYVLLTHSEEYHSSYVCNEGDGDLSWYGYG
jgi:hypothetical protein